MKATGWRFMFYIYVTFFVMSLIIKDFEIFNTLVLLGIFSIQIHVLEELRKRKCR